MTRQEYEAYLEEKCRLRGTTLAALLAERQMVIGPCHCDDYSECKGWRLYAPDLEEMPLEPPAVVENKP